jgi:hypothetical protein
VQCHHVDPETNVQCEKDATRRAIVRWADPPAPGQEGGAGTIFMVATCDEHDPDPRNSLPV